jgi:hypothetical protein
MINTDQVLHLLGIALLAVGIVLIILGAARSGTRPVVAAGYITVGFAVAVAGFTLFFTPYP